MSVGSRLLFPCLSVLAGLLVLSNLLIIYSPGYSINIVFIKREDERRIVEGYLQGNEPPRIEEGSVSSAPPERKKEELSGFEAEEGISDWGEVVQYRLDKMRQACRELNAEESVEDHPIYFSELGGKECAHYVGDR